LPDPKAIMRILFDTLKPNGKIFIAEFEYGPKSERFHPRAICANNVCARFVTLIPLSLWTFRSPSLHFA